MTSNFIFRSLQTTTHAATERTDLHVNRVMLFLLRWHAGGSGPTAAAACFIVGAQTQAAFLTVALVTPTAGAYPPPGGVTSKGKIEAKVTETVSRNLALGRIRRESWLHIAGEPTLLSLVVGAWEGTLRRCPPRIGFFHYAVKFPVRKVGHQFRSRRVGAKIYKKVAH